MDLGLVQALTTQHGSLAAVRCRLILRNHPRPVGRRERAPDRTSGRIYDYFSWARHRTIFDTRKNWTIATHETVSYHHPPRWARGLRHVSLQPDREGDDLAGPTPGHDLVGLDRHHHLPAGVVVHVDHMQAGDVEHFIGTGAPWRADAASTIRHAGASGDQAAWSLVILEAPTPTSPDRHAPPRADLTHAQKSLQLAACRRTIGSRLRRADATSPWTS